MPNCLPLRSAAQLGLNFKGTGEPIMQVSGERVTNHPWILSQGHTCK